MIGICSKVRVNTAERNAQKMTEIYRNLTRISRVFILSFKKFQPTLTCLKSTIKILEKGVKYVQS